MRAARAQDDLGRRVRLRGPPPDGAGQDLVGALHLHDLWGVGLF
jgi:hypothetical protein